ncbi:MAG: PAS domain S-box protein [Nostocaceae cyanobacterium]|nr:PAS domain S-box protein [Nostocaceae cyanobacterium]
MSIATWKILFVDDSESDIETYRRYLLRDKQRKYRILEARTGEEALLLCQQQFPDVIVIDYLLPDMDGLELLQELKAEFAKVCPPVIILTGQGNEQIAVQSMKSGAADYLVKKNTTQLNFIKAVENVLEKTQLSRQLEESKGRLQGTFNQASVGIAYVGLEGQLLQVNQKLCDIVGYPREELLNLTLQEITHPDDRNIDLEYFVRLLSGEIPTYSQEKRYIRQDYRQVWVNLTVSLVRKASGEPEYFICFVQDITQRKQLEADLRRRERQFSTLVENSPDIIFRLDRNLRHIYISPQVVRQSGIPTEQCLGKTGRELGLPPDVCDVFEAACQEALTTGRLTRVEYSIGDKHYVSRLIPEAAADGTVESLMGITEDITDLKHREANATFLAEIAEDLSRLSSADQIIQAVGAKIGAYLNVTTCNFCEVDEVRDEVIYLGRWQTEGAFHLPDRIRLSEQVSEDFLRRVHAGETIVSNNTQTNSVTNAQANAEIGVLSFITVPFHKNCQWKFLFSIHDIIPRTWRADEIELVQELANRIFPRLERARAEASVAADLKDTQLLRDLSVRLISEDDIQVLYDEIVMAAIALMHSDMGSLQILERSRNELYLQSCRGFHPDAVAFWSTVRVNEGSVCSMALQQGEQIIIPDIETCDVMAGTEALDYYRLCGIRAVQSTPLISRSGQVIGMFSTHWCQPYQPSDRELRFLDLLARQAADLIEQRQAEEKIREQAALLDISTDAIFVRDLENRILFWSGSAENLYGWTPEESLGKQAHKIFYRESLLELETGLKSTIEHGSWQGELEQITKTGKEITVQSRWTLMRDKSGKPQSILVVNTDITEKKQLQAQFYRAQRLESLGTLASGISHDLNNILTPILTVAQLLPLKFPHLDEKNRQLLKILEDNSQRGAELVKQITAFARGAEGKRVTLQPRHLLQEIARIVKSTFPKSIHISTNITAVNLWTVAADPTQIHQVLMNLCVNARDAMPDGGNISISADNFRVDKNYARMNLEAKVGDYVVITVSDTGCGMPPEVKERIFEPFFTTKETGQGTGLGLSTVIGIIKNHDGFLKVDSKVGEGSQFQVFLPAIKTAVTQSYEDSQMLKGNGELILVVDDEALVRDVAKTSLEVFNYRVLIASDSIEAFSLYAQYQNEISLVLMDIQMPSMDGLNVIRVLQRMNPAVKIIAISGLASNRQLLEARGIEVQGFLPKPYTMKELLDTIQGILSLT